MSDFALRALRAKGAADIQDGVENNPKDSALAQTQSVQMTEIYRNGPLTEIVRPTRVNHSLETFGCERIMHEEESDRRLPPRIEFADRMRYVAASAELPNVVAVRAHLGWDTGNALRRFAKRPDLLTDSAWRNGVGTLQRHGFKCVIELFAPQLRDLVGVVRLYPDIGFTIAVMGWPLDLGEAGHV